MQPSRHPGDPSFDEAGIRGIASIALAEGRSSLTELEGMDILDAMGFATPRRAFARGATDAARALSGGDFPGEKVVVKVVSASILHKTEVGGVSISRNAPDEVEAAVSAMEARFAGQDVEGYSINEFVAFEPGLGREVIAGCRFTTDFGPVASLGFGGIYAEYLASVLRPGSAHQKED